MRLHQLPAGLGLIALVATGGAAQTSHPKPNLPGQVVRVEAGEFFFRAPDTISSGLSTFVLSQVGDVLTNPQKVDVENLAPASATNDPTRAFHMLWVVRLDSGHTVNQWYDAEMKGERPLWVTNLGGPSGSQPPESANATMVLTPGNYVLVCYVGSAREDKNRHHLRKGMFKALTVRSSSAFADEPPAGDVRATITGTGQITLNGILREGTRSIRVVNRSTQAHEFIVSRVKPGHTAAEAVTWQRISGTDRPFRSVGGFSDVPPGATRLTTVNLEPGTYVLWTTRGPQTSMSFSITK